MRRSLTALVVDTSTYTGNLTYTISDAQMDVDPEVEELDSFSLLLPLPYRLAIIIVLGVWLWGLNLHGLHLFNIVSAVELAEPL